MATSFFQKQKNFLLSKMPVLIVPMILVFGAHRSIIEAPRSICSEEQGVTRFAFLNEYANQHLVKSPYQLNDLMELSRIFEESWVLAISPIPPELTTPYGFLLPYRYKGYQSNTSI